MVVARALRVFGWCVPGLVAFAALVPTSTRALVSHAKPARDYEAALALETALERGDTAAAPGGKSMLLVHGHRTPRAFVLFHGLTNSPRQFRDLADSIYKSGDNVFVPRLPRHGLTGATVSDLGKLTAEELREAADQSMDIVTGLGDTVVVFGLSLGGVMAAWITQFRAVDRTIIAAPALGLARVATSLEDPMMNLGLRIPDLDHRDPPDAMRPDRTPGWTSRGIAEMMKLGVSARRDARSHSPCARDIRVLVNAHDQTVSRAVIDALVADWKATGAHVTTYELADTLRLPHDIVDPDERGGRPSVTEPVILSLVRGEPPKPASGASVIDFAGTGGASVRKH